VAAFWRGSNPFSEGDPLRSANDPPGAASDRAYLERNCIALLSNFAKEPIDKPSERWLGLHSRQETIRKSGLWNTNHVGDGYTQVFSDVLEKCVRETM
jgi:hypothetical protein